MKAFEKTLLLASPTMHSEELEFVHEAFDKNWIAPLGFNCDGFEKEISDYLTGGLPTLATTSGTSALHLALKLAGLKTGERVFCSDLTFAASVNPVCYEGGIPVLIDSERETWNMDPDALEEAFAKYPGTKYVVVVHLFGTPAKMDEILAICERHGAALIEDAAESLGSEYNGKKCGTFGAYSALSFNGNKIITTSGGGMLITKSKEDRDKALFFATQTREPAPWYQHKELGYNYRMSNVVAGIGRGQLLHLKEHCDKKAAIYNRYKTGFAGIPVKMNPYLSCSHPNFWLSCITVDPEYLCEQRRTDLASCWVHEAGKSCPDEIAATLQKYNVQTRPLWKPMHLQPYYEKNDFIGNGVDEDLFARGICLPSDIKMTEEEQNDVIEIIKSCFEA